MILCFLCALTAGAQTTNNDSSCDVSVTPAATLLLPYFEIDLAEPRARARTTLFTVINTSALPQIARATIWTDWAYPVLTFNLFLTGYDVASVNLYDVLASGRIATAGAAPPGRLSAPNFANPNHAPTVVYDCTSGPATVPPALLENVRSVLTAGRLTSSEARTCAGSVSPRAQLGGNHGTSAIGYVTIDVVATCSSTMPADPRYFTSELLYDNVLTGDWIATTDSHASASPLVHIRAVPEGGPAGTRAPRQLPYTFYGRLLSDRPLSERMADRRQPLPSTFAARFIEGGTGFETRMMIWREGSTGARAACGDYELNARMEIADIVRFDEHENATVYDPTPGIDGPPKIPFGLPATSSVRSNNYFLPPLYSPHDDVGGWFYLNLVRANESGKVSFGAGQHQAWVTMTMYSEGRYATTFDAAAVENGCSPIPTYGVQVGANVTP